MKKSKILTILMVLVLMFSLVACSTAKNNDKSQSNNTADISDLMESEPSNLDDATALYQKLMQKENEILSSNSQLWEKVFMCSEYKNEFKNPRQIIPFSSTRRYASSVQSLM